MKKTINITIPEIRINGTISGNGVEAIIASANSYVDILNSLITKLSTFAHDVSALSVHQSTLFSRYTELEEIIPKKETELKKLNNASNSLADLDIVIPDELKEKIEVLSSELKSLQNEMDENISESTEIEEFFESFSTQEKQEIPKMPNKQCETCDVEPERVVLEAYLNTKYNCIAFKVIEGDTEIRYAPDKKLIKSSFFPTIKVGERFLLGNHHELEEDMGWKVYIDSLIALDRAEKVVDNGIITDANDLSVLADKFNKKVC